MMPCSILVAHSNRTMCCILKRLLTPFYRVVICHDPWRALSHIAEDPPDLIIFDPLPDNYALATFLRAHFTEREVTLLALAPRMRALEARRAKYAGARYLACPFAAPAFLHLVHTLLREKKQSHPSLLAAPDRRAALAYSA